jgi:hypothetical protein
MEIGAIKLARVREFRLLLHEQQPGRMGLSDARTTDRSSKMMVMMGIDGDVLGKSKIGC